MDENTVKKEELEALKQEIKEIKESQTYYHLDLLAGQVLLAAGIEEIRATLNAIVAGFRSVPAFVADAKRRSLEEIEQKRNESILSNVIKVHSDKAPLTSCEIYNPEARQKAAFLREMWGMESRHSADQVEDELLRNIQRAFTILVEDKDRAAGDILARIRKDVPDIIPFFKNAPRDKVLTEEAKNAIGAEAFVRAGEILDLLKDYPVDVVKLQVHKLEPGTDRRRQVGELTYPTSESKKLRDIIKAAEWGGPGDYLLVLCHADGKRVDDAIPIRITIPPEDEG